MKKTFYILAPDYRIAVYYCDVNGLNPREMHFIATEVDVLRIPRLAKVLIIERDNHGPFIYKGVKMLAFSKIRDLKDSMQFDFRFVALNRRANLIPPDE